MLGYNDKFPETVSMGDIYKYGSFEYHYNQSYIDNSNGGFWIDENGNDDWGVATLSKTLKYYSNLLTNINGYDIVDTIHLLVVPIWFNLPLYQIL